MYPARGMSNYPVFLSGQRGELMYKKSDPTADRAIGAAGREWRRMTLVAYRYRTDPRFMWRVDNPRQLFSGVYHRLLTDPLVELEEAISGKQDD